MQLAAREVARTDLLAFTKYTKKNYRAGRVHRLIANALEDVLAGRTKRLIIDVPPRHGKSELASRKFPAYYLGRFPENELIAASYGSELATSFGRDVRNLIDGLEYKALFPDVSLATDSQAKNKWHTNKGGVFLAAGVGGAIVGMGAHVLLIDDPVKSRAEAESQTYRDAVWAWYTGSAYPRLMPGGAIIVIMTRWHEDDLVGKLMQAEAEGGEEWTKLVLPAIDEEGEALWPEAYGLDDLKRIRKTIGELEWTSQYEQQPRPIGGSFFTMDDMLVNGLAVAQPTLCDGVFAVIDSAVKTGKENDGTGVTYYARSKHIGHPLTILDWDITQIEGASLEKWIPIVFDRLEELAKACNARAGALGVWIEDKSSGMILLQQMRNKGKRAHAIDSKLTSVGKAERAISVSGYVNNGRVKFSEHAYNKVKTYKGATRNHLLSQVLSFHIGTKDMGDDDLFDTFTYGVSIALGQSDGI